MSDLEGTADVEGDSPEAPQEGENSKVTKKQSSHPKIGIMVNAAITNLKGKNGSSAYAITKYIAVHYELEADKMAPLIKKYLKSAVISGSLIQTTGKGASGSFKIANPKMVKPKKVDSEVDDEEPKKQKVKKDKTGMKPPKKKTDKEKAAAIVKPQTSPVKKKVENSNKEKNAQPQMEPEKASSNEVISSAKRKATKVPGKSPKKTKTTGKSPVKPKIPKPKKVSKKSPKKTT